MSYFDYWTTTSLGKYGIHLIETISCNCLRLVIEETMRTSIRQSNFSSSQYFCFTFSSLPIQILNCVKPWRAYCITVILQTKAHNFYYNLLRWSICCAYSELFREFTSSIGSEFIVRARVTKKNKVVLLKFNFKDQTFFISFNHLRFNPTYIYTKINSIFYAFYCHELNDINSLYDC